VGDVQKKLKQKAAPQILWAAGFLGKKIRSPKKGDNSF